MTLTTIVVTKLLFNNSKFALFTLTKTKDGVLYNQRQNGVYIYFRPYKLLITFNYSTSFLYLILVQNHFKIGCSSYKIDLLSSDHCMTQTNASNFCYECRHIHASMHSHTHTHTLTKVHFLIYHNFLSSEEY